MGAVTTEVQNRCAQLLENATSRELRQVAEWAIEHIEDRDELVELRKQLDLHLWTLDH